MKWEEKNVLITGATGFVGSWLTKNLVEKKANVVVLIRDHFPSSPLFYNGTYPKIKAARGDIVDYNSVRRIFNEYEIDTCLHVAAQPIVTIANRNPIPTFKTNIEGTWNILEVARKCETLERLVITSTDKVYGEPSELPITEEHPLNASYPYDASKACADMLARTYSVTYGLPIGITRCCNIYGGGDLNFSRIIPETVKAVIFKRSPVIRSDGTPVRDFIYIEDVVNAYLTLAENVNKKSVKGDAFNFGSNSPINILDLVNKIIKVSGKKIEAEVKGKKKPHAEIDEQYLSSKKAKKILRWEPEVPLDEGLKRTIKWYEQYFTNTSKVSS